jgi:hypothetical protein
MIVDTLGGICRSMERSGDQTWGQLLSILSKKYIKKGDIGQMHTRQNYNIKH